MKVLILEDVIEHQVRLERILDEISKESNIPISYKTTGKVREFEEYIENDEVNQLYFLDIDIHGTPIIHPKSKNHPESLP
ncbi:response regulator [Streptococcus pneumoniae]|nr:response regulator [Streptococcus pneumoniae]CVZ84690.1 response regulator [Streptococcus pneumoniae]